jgi:hypothetical protein
MAARKVISACAMLLIILLTFTLGPEGARGQANMWRLIGPGIVESGGSVYLLDTANAPQGWNQLPVPSITLPPVPASSLTFYDEQRAITDAGEGWGKVGGVWTDLGPIPGLVPTVHQSWGQLKARYVK